MKPRVESLPLNLKANEMDRKYGFGIIGTGAIATMHARGIQELPRAELIGVFNHRPEKAQVFAETHQTKAYARLEQLLADPLVDVICICTPSGAHLEPALAAVAAGKHCLIEKPLEITSARCLDIIQAAQQRGVQVSTIFPTRFHPAALKVKEALQQGKFGDLVLGNAYVKWSRPAAYYQSASWRGTWALDGGGALMNQGIHALDLLLWYMGPVSSVHAVSANRKHKEIEVEDTIVAQMKFQSGALGTIECTTAAYTGSPKTIEIIGTKGRVSLEEDHITSWDFEDQSHKNAKGLLNGGKTEKSGHEDPMAIGHWGHRRQIENFLHALDNGEAADIAGKEGAKAVHIIEAIYQSARQGKTIVL